MIKSITFKEDYDYLLEKESQKRFKVKTIRPTKYSREKKPYKMFTIFPKGLKIEFNFRHELVKTLLLNIISTIHKQELLKTNLK